MRYTSALIPTLKEAPSDATSQSHILLLRAGYVRRVGAGIYSYLPLGVRVLRRVERVVREEMDRAGALEVSLPALLPSEYFKETGRWDVFGDILFRLKDRKGSDYHLGPTHEEIITDMARREIHSYRDMPRNLYQIQSKFRDEPRPRGGLLRCREFSMKDAYSFDSSEDAARASYEKMRIAYTRIFDRMGLTYRMVSADSGAMGGSGSAEFQVLVQSGEDFIAACSSCDYAANLEVAETPARAPTGDGSQLPPRERVSTPGQRTIEEVSTFLRAEPARFLKSLLYVAGTEVVMAVVRGDHELNEIKLARALGVGDVFLASEEDVRKATGAAVGFAGPVGFAGKLLVDRDAMNVIDGITGANETDAHFIHVQPGRDFEARVADLRSVKDGDPCPSCGQTLKVYRGIEAGHIFLLGTHYSDKMGATYLDESGTSRPIVMGCYGIGVSRLIATTVEQFNDSDGIAWPISLAPYQVHVVQLGAEPEVVAAVTELERELEARGLEVLVDDREERPGVKFKDADLIGVPLRITVGKKALDRGGVEFKPRSERDPKKAELVLLGDAADLAAQWVKDRLAALTPESSP
ncbi:MAG: proline--tRNA ligase [Polyangiaceae bacterium]|nr:proline--tRNA ligase [Polyangiaceae bacterium]